MPRSVVLIEHGPVVRGSRGLRGLKFEVGPGRCPDARVDLKARCCGAAQPPDTSQGWQKPTVSCGYGLSWLKVDHWAGSERSSFWPGSAPDACPGGTVWRDSERHILTAHGSPAADAAAPAPEYVSRNARPMACR